MDSSLERVLYNDPKINSRASLILLKKDLLRKVAYYGYQGWLRFRWELLNELLKTRGELRCEYCDFGPLLIEPENQETTFLATLDHVNPISLGGPKWDRNNLVVSCFPCNRNKKNIPIHEWLEIRRRQKKI